MRASTRFLLFLLAAAALLAGAGVHAAGERAARSGEIAARRALVKRLGLTDLCLFTEARYTRHPTQADLFAPFQDHPGALEHFPSGALVPAPER
jgi:hypothetical protein